MERFAPLVAVTKGVEDLSFCLMYRWYLDPQPKFAPIYQLQLGSLASHIRSALCLTKNATVDTRTSVVSLFFSQLATFLTVSSCLVLHFSAFSPSYGSCVSVSAFLLICIPLIYLIICYLLLDICLSRSLTPRQLKIVRELANQGWFSNEEDKRIAVARLFDEIALNGLVATLDVKECLQVLLLVHKDKLDGIFQGSPVNRSGELAVVVAEALKHEGSFSLSLSFNFSLPLPSLISFALTPLLLLFNCFSSHLVHGK